MEFFAQRGIPELKSDAWKFWTDFLLQVKHNSTRILLNAGFSKTFSQVHYSPKSKYVEKLYLILTIIEVRVRVHPLTEKL